MRLKNTTLFNAFYFTIFICLLGTNLKFEQGFFQLDHAKTSLIEFINSAETLAVTREDTSQSIRVNISHKKRISKVDSFHTDGLVVPNPNKCLYFKIIELSCILTKHFKQKSDLNFKLARAPPFLNS